MDHDGDMCEIICADTELGRIIIDGIRPFKYEIWKKGEDALYKKLNWYNIVDHWATVGSTKDRTGVITNYATKSLDIANHLQVCLKIAIENGCDSMTFSDPINFGDGLGWDYKPEIKVWKNKKKSLYVKGFKAFKLEFDPMRHDYVVAADFGKDFKPSQVRTHGDIYVDKNSKCLKVLGVKTLKEVEEIIEYFKGVNLILRLIQGDEIDGAKTGFYPSIPKFCKITSTPWNMLERQEVLGREQSAIARANVYQSLSPLGYVYEFGKSLLEEVNTEFTDKGRSKVQLLKALLTAEENEMLNSSTIGFDGREYNTLIDAVTNARKSFNLMLYKRNTTDSSDEETYGILKEQEAELLRQSAEALGVTPEVMAAACYISTYNDNSKTGKSLTYGWMLFDELISIFSRRNKKFELFRMPKNVESAFIKDGYMFINEQRRFKVDAYDNDNVVIQVINGNPYALIQKKAKEIAETKPFVKSKLLHYITVYGMKFYLQPNGDEPLVKQWFNIIKENNYSFDIVMDERGDAVIAVNGRIISGLNQNFDHSLVGAKVLFCNGRTFTGQDENGKRYAGEKIPAMKYQNDKGEILNSIQNVAVWVTGEADPLK